MRRLLLAVAALGLAYLFFWPVRLAPVAWQPPSAPALDGPDAPNDALAKVEWLGRGTVDGPEAVAADAQGRIYAGLRDGRIVRFDPASARLETFANTGGRPLGLQLDRAGNLIVCDAEKGLLLISPAGPIKELTNSEGGVPFRFTDDVDVGADGTIYFTDASSKYGKDNFTDDILEHGGQGRLLAYHPDSGKTEKLVGELNFANGVAVSGDQSFVLVNETGSYRILRYWLAGPNKGTLEPFLEDLPGFPDNITWSKERGVFWVAIFAPRDPIVDALAGWPFLRKVIKRIPAALQPKPKRVAMALAVNPQGQVVLSLQDRAPASFSPVTSVRESGGYLYLGSLLRDAIGRVRAP